MNTRADNPSMAPSTSPKSLRLSMAIRAGINQIACVLIAVMLWLFGIDKGFWSGLVFSLLIGNFCWLFIDVGRAVVAGWLYRQHGGSTGWPGWPWMAPIVVIGTVFGYLLGHAAARAVLGLPAGVALVHTPVLMFSVLAAMVVSYIFYARERLHIQQLQAEAAERLASELQLKLLQSQLEPHMLFNTLANLRVLIGLDPVRAQAMLDRLIAYLRATLQASRVTLHPLADEFDRLADYLALMQVRMGARLVVSLDLPVDLRPLRVPPLILQPLVENSIRHGLEPQVAGGSLRVTAQRVGTELQLRVTDDGAGLGSTPAGPPSTGFGLEQVRSRLSTLYGPQAALEVQAGPEGRGTQAQVRLPIEPAPDTPTTGPST